MDQDGAQGHHVGGSVAKGRYQLRDLLGQGGMASVHLAYDSVLDRQVAIKTLHTELGREQSFRERFRREAQSVAKLSHTNIVSVFDTGEDELGGLTVPYIVMEYVEGQPLGSVLQEDVQRYGAMPADRALKVTADVLAALETSHEFGLVHRDIKPGNVMLNRRGIVKVMDFGIARAMQSGVTSMTQTGMVVGTPQYLSPEQALGRGVDARSDLYSVGVMLFQLLTGRLPFDADSPLAIAYAHVQEEPPAPSTINRSLTPAMDALVLRALKKNPNERFPNAEAMRAECLRVAGGGQAAAPAIVGGAPAPSSGAGVGSAVFPSAQAPQQAPYAGPPHPQSPPHGVARAPYPQQQQPHAAPYGAGPGHGGHGGHTGHGPGTPPPQMSQMPQQGVPRHGTHGQHPQQGHPQHGHPQQGHPQQGHPQQGLGQQAPPTPRPYGYPQTGGLGAHVAPPYAAAPTPAPMTRPGGRQGPGRGRRLVFIVLGAFGALLLLNFGFRALDTFMREDPVDVSIVDKPTGQAANGSGGADSRTDTGSDAEPGAEPDAGSDAGSATGSTDAIPPDRTRTIKTEKCTDPLEDSSDPGKVYAPDLLYKDVLSVKECLRAGGWTWKVTEVDNPQYPKDAVVQQFPSGDSPVGKRQQFELHISTGKGGTGGG
ncbi:protein kinase [Streptomyces sp. NPDC058953]|uniref:protein kinase domain-containing protein n=1 Tax=unclassified Streptomyces TaxID=2593676 RepID=UPI0036AC40F9